MTDRKEVMMSKRSRIADKKMFSIQAESDLLEAFKDACENNDETQSQVVRRFMREYVSKPIE